MENNSKNNPKINLVHEPITAYQSKPEMEEVDAFEDFPKELIALLEIGLKQCENGETKLHSEVMDDMKKKFNWKF